MDKQTIKQFSQFIPIRKWRHNFRNSVYKFMKAEKEQSAIKVLNKYIDLITYTDNREQKKRILKENLHLIEVEISSFCNRKCWFCPNSIIDRKSQSIDMNEDLYVKILNDLAEISYSGNFHFHRFNETLANKELVLKRISQTREKLPNASLAIFTNGDYLDREYLDNLRDCGVNWILMSFYFNKNQEFDITNLIQPAIDKMAKKLDLQYRVILDNIQEYKVQFDYDIDVFYRAWNPRQIGSNRGGTIGNIGQEKKIRDYGCYYPLSDLYIDYNGLVMPCCNLRSDVKSHEDFILGDTNKNDLFEIFNSHKMIDMRKYLTGNTPKDGPCKYCDYQTNRFMQEDIIL